MLRREAKYKPTFDRVSVHYQAASGDYSLPQDGGGWVMQDWGRTKKHDLAEGMPWARQNAIAAQEKEPQPLNPPATNVLPSGPVLDFYRNYWLFRGKVYSTSKGLKRVDVRRLLAPRPAKSPGRHVDVQATGQPFESGEQPRLETRFAATLCEVEVPYERGVNGIGVVTGDLTDGMAWANAGAEAAQQSEAQPLNPPSRIVDGGRRSRADDSRDYWLFRGEVYSTERGVCSSEDVKALALEGENKTKAKLARAHALMAQVDVLERTGRQPIPDDVKMFVWQRDGGKCVRCGSNRNLEFDHIIPVVMGGANTARNLQLLCEGCNRAKSGSLV